MRAQIHSLPFVSILWIAVSIVVIVFGGCAAPAANLLYEEEKQ